MAILESVRELASKLGADTNGRTIADQINIINQHLEADTANDIAGAVKEYSKKAGSGGGGGETFEVNISATETPTVDKTYAEIKAAIESNKKISGIIDVLGAQTVNILNGCVNDIVNDGQTQVANAIIIISEVFVPNWQSNTDSAVIYFIITPENTYVMDLLNVISH